MCKVLTIQRLEFFVIQLDCQAVLSLASAQSLQRHIDRLRVNFLLHLIAHSFAIDAPLLVLLALIFVHQLLLQALFAALNCLLYCALIRFKFSVSHASISSSSKRLVINTFLPRCINLLISGIDTIKHTANVITHRHVQRIQLLINLSHPCLEPLEHSMQFRIRRFAFH